MTQPGETVNLTLSNPTGGATPASIPGFMQVTFRLRDNLRAGVVVRIRD